MDELVFYDGCPKQSVWESDQAAEFRAALEKYCLEESVKIYHQLCEKHMFNNIQAFVQRSRRYKTAEYLIGIWSVICDYIPCTNKDDLQFQKNSMFELMEGVEQKYYESEWSKKEYRALRAYTREKLNLEVHSTQRNKSMNDVIKMFLNQKMTLDETCKELIRTVVAEEMTDLAGNAKAQMSRQIMLTPALHHLDGIITNLAMQRMKPEMQATDEFGEITPSVACNCENHTQ